MPSLATRKHLVAIARFAAAFGWVASAGPVAAQQYAPPPDTSIVCPAIDEDGMLCSADFMSGNCADFVSRADQLGALYRSELKKLPGSEASLKTTIWWGCGPGNLQNIKTLLVQIGPRWHSRCCRPSRIEVSRRCRSPRRRLLRIRPPRNRSATI